MTSMERRLNPLRRPPPHQGRERPRPKPNPHIPRAYERYEAPEVA
jgi:hypothetical protein